MNHDIPPTDQEIMDRLTSRAEGFTPKELVESFNEEGYLEHDIIKAIQRAFDRGLVQLSTGARLTCADTEAAVAA